uniref:Uncharacterized protein n=1 Tax=Magallana gigas TaxID=29159 RepID=A0A8W8NNI0_MAGGI
MSQAFQNRREELDMYEANIIDIFNVYGDRFYEYHKLFSLKSASALAIHKIKVDWSARDRDLIQRIASRDRSCSICSLVSNDTKFWHRSAWQKKNFIQWSKSATILIQDAATVATVPINTFISSAKAKTTQPSHAPNQTKPNPKTQLCPPAPEKKISGFTFRLDTKVKRLNLEIQECKNLLSAQQNKSAVIELSSEIIKGFLSSPYQTALFQQYKVSPLGIAKRKYSKNKRLIVDLSATHNNDTHPSINDLIDKDECSLSYVSIGDANKCITKFGRDALICKTDKSDVFKLVPILPSQYHLFCVKWKN